MENKRAEKPKYVVASTSYGEEETLVFEANDFSISSFDDYGGLAKRWGDENWNNPEDAVKACFPNDIYVLIDFREGDKVGQSLWRKIMPDELTFWDSDEANSIVY
jgi:hypothetical protein